MFANRHQAGLLLAKKVKEEGLDNNAIVYGIARGGVVVAHAVSEALALPLDVVAVKKIGHPDQEELAIGAVAPGNVVYWDEMLCQKLSLTKRDRHILKQKKQSELNNREALLRRFHRKEIKGKTALLIDDGVATGATVLAANLSLRKRGVKKVILAVPVIASDTWRKIHRYFDCVIALSMPDEFRAVGMFYESFPQVLDEEVVALLQQGLHK